MSDDKPTHLRRNEKGEPECQVELARRALMEDK